jgi:hypothetical protein
MMQEEYQQELERERQERESERAQLASQEQSSGTV